MSCTLANNLCFRSGFVLGQRICHRQLAQRSFRNVLSDENTQQADCIGPPDPVSNIRQIRFATRPDETTQELALRLYQISLQEKNHRFWEGHNENWAALKQQLHDELDEIENEEDTELVLQQFYKSYLAKSGPSFKEYSKQWAQSNGKLVWLSIRARNSRYKAWKKGHNKNFGRNISRIIFEAPGKFRK